MSDDIFAGVAKRPAAPESEALLLQRVQALAGTTLGQLAAVYGWSVPNDLRRHKGWVGSLLEYALGCDAGSQALPDFVSLGIELKTLPLNARGLPKESTYVCTAALQPSGIEQWQDSWLRRKLAKVLWLPIEADSSIAVAERYIGRGWLWQPDAEQDAILRQDWEELMEQLALGEQAQLTARQGQYLQIRPKAAHSRVLKKSSNADGDAVLANPRGFYLRTTFTRQLLEAVTISN